MSTDSESFGIGELARRTKLTVSTIRAWEHRHGFPNAERLPSGHRRYTTRDVDALNEVVAARAAGTTLAVALTNVRLAAEAPQSSVMATLRHELADSEPFVLSKLSMYAISRAIEDEALSRSSGALLVGGFQQLRFWQASEHRWRHLAGVSSVAIALATMPRRRRRDRLWEVPLEPGAVMTHEWLVVCDSPSFSACLAGVELATKQRSSSRAADRARRFEALWTVDAPVVRKAARAACTIAAATTPELDGAVEPHWRRPATDTARSLRAATPLTNRIIRNLDLAKWRS